MAEWWYKAIKIVKFLLFSLFLLLMTNIIIIKIQKNNSLVKNDLTCVNYFAYINSKKFIYYSQNITTMKN